MTRSESGKAPQAAQRTKVCTGSPVRSWLLACTTQAYSRRWCRAGRGDILTEGEVSEMVLGSLNAGLERDHQERRQERQAGEDQEVWEPEKELELYPLKRSGFI